MNSVLRLSVEYGVTKFGQQVLMLKLCCCKGQQAPFPVATCPPLTSYSVSNKVSEITRDTTCSTSQGHTSLSFT